MLLSKLVCERTKEAPQDAKIKSHVLLSRAGFIKQVAVGIYSMTMPCQKMSVAERNMGTFRQIQHYRKRNGKIQG